MSQDGNNSVPIEGRQDLIDALALGCKPKAEWRIGTEHEKFPFARAGNRPVPYEGAQGIGALLENLQREGGGEAVLDRGKIIGLDLPQGGSISLEPGGQFELSGAPLANLHQTCREIGDHLDVLKKVASSLDIGFLGLGASPLWSLEDTPIMPKQRYEIMRRYMPKVGTGGRDMMFRSCTVQVNLDFGSEADMVQKLRVALALQPIATAIFAASPFLGGKPSGKLSTRAHFWRDLDPARAGTLPLAFEDGFGFERYVDWALDVPLYFVKRGDIYHDVAGASFRDLLEGRLAALPGEKATVSDWESHLSTLFPDARIKRFMEMRGADGGPHENLCALSALWTGILYHQPSLDAASDLIKPWSAAARETLADEVPFKALGAEIAGQSALDLAKIMIELAAEGLRARAALNSLGEDESMFLAPLRRITERGTTLAEELLKKYHGPWQEDLTPIFHDTAYW